ncbi:MAG: UDP-N-acetyl-D-mannosamine dehydrogenase [Balneolaceae bacterium]
MIDKVTVIGLGYIGLPTAALLAKNQILVYGVDINKSVVDTVNRGQIHIKEPDLKEIVKEVVSNGFLKASLVPTASDVYLIVVPTPFKGKNEPDISFVEAAVKSILHLLKESDLVIIESTSPIGTTEKISEQIFSARPELKESLNISYCPERVLPGNIMYELVHNDRVVGGINEVSTIASIEFYKRFVKGELHKTNARTAEMCKLVENSSRDVQIAFANELSLICDKADINVWELINLANKHPRVNILQPGSGVGGHCIAVDPYFIVSEFPLESQLIGKAREINNYKAFWVSEKIKNTMLEFEIKNGRKPKLALLGLAFKPNVDDLRESPAKYIVQKVLQNTNNEEIYIVEPNIKAHKVFKLTDVQKAIKQAEIVAYLVNHKEFRGLGKPENKIILDFCGVFS